jgi:O-antigen/teichoic acid export membrane protein
LTSFSNGLTAGFGEVISKGESETLRKSYSTYEYMYIIILFIVTVCMGVLILPFVSVYTMNMTDTNYMRPVIAGLFTVIVLLQNIRIPGLTIICAAGHYKETQYQAILEAVINIIVSVLCIHKFGMAGVLFGTACSYAYRSVEVMIYNHKKLVKGSGGKSLARVLRNLVMSILLIFAGIKFVPQQMDSFIIWFVYALAAGVVSAVAIVVVNMGFEPKEFKALIKRVTGIIRK